MGPFQIQPRRFDGRLRSAHRGTTLCLRTGPAVELLARDCLYLHQLTGSLNFALRQRRGRTSPLQLRFGTGQLRLVGPRIDLEQDLALLYLFTFDEGDALDVSGDPWMDLDLVHRLETARELIPFRDLALGHLGDRDRLRWRRGGRILSASHVQGSE